jgi:hypothetical protein
MIQSVSKGPRELIVVGDERGPVRSQNPQIKLAVEKRSSEAVGGRGVAVRAGSTVNEAFEAETTEVIRHLGRGVRTTEQGFDVGTTIAIAEAPWQMRESAERLQQGHDTWVAKPQSGHPLTGVDGGL